LTWCIFRSLDLRFVGRQANLCDAALMALLEVPVVIRFVSQLPLLRSAACRYHTLLLDHAVFLMKSVYFEWLVEIPHTTVCLHVCCSRFALTLRVPRWSLPVVSLCLLVALRVALAGNSLYMGFSNAYHLISELDLSVG